MISMLKKLMGCVREYKTVSVLTPILMIGEVVMECLIPFVIAGLVGQIEAGCEFSVIVKHGLVLFAMACVSLFFGGMAGVTGSKASCVDHSFHRDAFIVHRR